MSRKLSRKVIIRDEADLDPSKVELMQYVHRMFTLKEISTDSNEREMIGVKELLIGSEQVIKNTVCVLHVDNMNVATILEKGSNKYRLHETSLFVHKLCSLWGVELRPVWIPRYDYY